MKNYTQVYVKNSFEAAQMYCKAFGAEITREFRNEDNTAYDHCELSVNGEGKRGSGLQRISCFERWRRDC